MGINGLWELVKETGRKKTIPELVEENEYSYEVQESHMLKLGVDISVMFDECLAAEHSTKLFGHRYGGALCIFFYKLCKFLRFPAIFIFVFDGPGRPTTKRGRCINSKKDPWWVEACINMITSIGFHIHKAPGEAEAELGRLSQLNMIDGVISTDGDALVYGARKVLKRIPKSNGAYEVYTNTAILEGVSYGPGDILLLALFSGGDYSNGVPNCGAAIVTALVQCGFGARLHQYLSKLHGIELENALIALSKDIKNELQTNSKHCLTSRKPNIAEHITPDLFSSATRLLYTDPLTSWSSPHHPIPNELSWTTREPDLLDVIQVCRIHLGWNTVDKLVKNLHNVLLEGLFVRAICSPEIDINRHSRQISTSSQDFKVLQLSVKRRRNEARESPLWGRLKVLAITARDAITTIGGKDRDTSSEVTKMFTTNLWVPLFYLPPNLFSILPSFNRPAKGSKKGKKRDHFTAFANPSTQAESSSMALRRESYNTNSESVIDLTLDDDSEPAAFPCMDGEVIDLTADVEEHPSKHSIQAVSEVIDITDSD